MPPCHCVTEYALTLLQLLALNLLSAMDDQGWDRVASVDMSIGTSAGGECESTSSQSPNAQVLIWVTQWIRGFSLVVWRSSKSSGSLSAAGVAAGSASLIGTCAVIWAVYACSVTPEAGLLLPDVTF
jgi:hypothetical protein